MIKRDNLIAVIVALVLSILFVIWINKIEYLRADINVNKKEELNVDFLVEKKDNILRLASNRNFENVQSIIFKLIYNPENKEFEVIWNNYSITDVEENIKEVMVIINWQLKKWDEIIKIDMKWWQINISDISILFNDWKYEKDFIFLLK